MAVSSNSTLVDSFEHVNSDEFKLGDEDKNERISADSPDFKCQYYSLPIQEFYAVNFAKQLWSIVLEAFFINKTPGYAIGVSFGEEKFGLLLKYSTKPEDRLGLYCQFRSFLTEKAQFKPFRYYVNSSFKNKVRPIGCEFNEFCKALKLGQLQKVIDIKCKALVKSANSINAEGYVANDIFDAFDELSSFINETPKIDVQSYNVEDASKPYDRRIRYKCDNLNIVKSIASGEGEELMNGLIPAYALFCSDFFIEVLKSIGIQMPFSEFINQCSSSIDVEFLFYPNEKKSFVDVHIRLFFIPSEVDCRFREINNVEVMTCCNIKVRLIVNKSASLLSIALNYNNCHFSACRGRKAPSIVPTWLLSIPNLKQYKSDLKRYLNCFSYDDRVRACSLLNVFCNKNKIDIERISAFFECKKLALPEYKELFTCDLSGTELEYNILEQCLRFTVVQANSKYIVDQLVKDALKIQAGYNNPPDAFNADFHRTQQYLVEGNKLTKINPTDKDKVLSMAGANAWLLHMFASQALHGICMGDLFLKEKISVNPFCNIGDQPKFNCFYQFFGNETLILTVTVHRDVNTCTNQELKAQQLDQLSAMGETLYRSALYVFRMKMCGGKMVHFEHEVTFGPLIGQDEAALPEFVLEKDSVMLLSQGLVDSPNWFDDDKVDAGLIALSACLDVTRPSLERVEAFFEAKTLAKPLLKNNFRCIEGDKFTMYKVLGFEFKFNRCTLPFEPFAAILNRLINKENTSNSEKLDKVCNNFTIYNHDKKAVAKFDSSLSLSMEEQIGKTLGFECLNLTKLLTDPSFISEVNKLINIKNLSIKLLDAPLPYKISFYIQQGCLEINISAESDMKSDTAFQKWVLDNDDVRPNYKNTDYDDEMPTYTKCEIKASLNTKTGISELQKVVFTSSESLREFRKVVNKQNLHYISSNFLTKRTEPPKKTKQEAQQAHSDEAAIPIEEKVFRLLSPIALRTDFSSSSAVTHFTNLDDALKAAEDNSTSEVVTEDKVAAEGELADERVTVNKVEAHSAMGIEQTDTNTNYSN